MIYSRCLLYEDARIFGKEGWLEGGGRVIVAFDL